MKTSSLYALAAAGVIVGGFALSPAPAKAADLGGAGGDLEERVSELEATTARKGNRKVSLEIYGQVNRALLMWDDGKDSDAYVVDNNHSSTRAGFRGEGKIAHGWKSGFNIEFEFVDSSSTAVDNARLDPGVGDEGKGEAGPINTRQAFFYVESEQFGRVSLGHQNDATKELTIINLSGAGVVSDARSFWNNNFHVRTPGGGKSVKWGLIADGLDSDRGDYIRYDTPSLFGFVLSTAWGENDQWDIALRFKKEWNSIRVAGGVGYYYNGDLNTGAGYSSQADSTREEIKGSFSALHVPTGLYVSFATGERFNQYLGLGNPRGRIERNDASFWYIQGGIDKRFFSYGSTTLYGEYGNYSDFGTFTQSVHAGGDLASSNVDRWGLGVVQKFDAAALEVYAAYQHYEADLKSYDSAATSATTAQPTEAWAAGVVGARIKF